LVVMAAKESLLELECKLVDLQRLAQHLIKME